MQEMPFQRSKFQKNSGGAWPRTPLKLCRHYGLPLTKILATPLMRATMFSLKVAIGMTATSESNDPPKVAIGMAAKSESNDLRYFRNFTVNTMQDRLTKYWSKSPS